MSTGFGITIRRCVAFLMAVTVLIQIGACDGRTDLMTRNLSVSGQLSASGAVSLLDHLDVFCGLGTLLLPTGIHHRYPRLLQHRDVDASSD